MNTIHIARNHYEKQPMENKDLDIKDAAGFMGERGRISTAITTERWALSEKQQGGTLVSKIRFCKRYAADMTSLSFPAQTPGRKHNSNVQQHDSTDHDNDERTAITRQAKHHRQHLQVSRDSFASPDDCQFSGPGQMRH